jgi:hypothetical protein
LISEMLENLGAIPNEKVDVEIKKWWQIWK